MRAVIELPFYLSTIVTGGPTPLIEDNAIF